MALIVFFIAQWYISLFTQTFFLHRYAAHGMFTMSKNWERFFFIFTFIAQGSNYLSPYGYGVMHRMHHAFTDTDKDPHSPKYSKNLMDMMMQTLKTYQAICKRKLNIDARFTRNVPDWLKFDKIAGHNGIRLVWVVLYVLVYVWLATAWWQWLFLPITLAMAPVHGAIINWYAHKFGSRRFEMSNTATNFLPVDFLMMGESYHNNHHKFDTSANFGVKWFEFDPTYYIIILLDKCKVIQLKPELIVARNKERRKESRFYKKSY